MDGAAVSSVFKFEKEAIQGQLVNGLRDLEVTIWCTLISQSGLVQNLKCFLVHAFHFGSPDHF